MTLDQPSEHRVENAELFSLSHLFSLVLSSFSLPYYVFSSLSFLPPSLPSFPPFLPSFLLLLFLSPPCVSPGLPRSRCQDGIKGASVFLGALPVGEGVLPW